MPQRHGSGEGRIGVHTAEPKGQDRLTRKKETGKYTQQDPAHVAEIQLEQLHFIPLRLPLAQIQRLHNIYLRIFIEIIKGEAVAVIGDDAGEYKQHGPQEHKQVDHDVQSDDFAGEGEPVEQHRVFRAFPAADVHAVEGKAGG